MFLGRQEPVQHEPLENVQQRIPETGQIARWLRVGEEGPGLEVRRHGQELE